MKTDRASMAWSLETRVPFLDPAVANFAFSLPVRHKVRGLSKKRLLRKAMEPLLPDAVVNGRKRGFSIPAAAWLRGELEPFARETLAPETVRRQGYLRPEAVTSVLDRHVSGARGSLAPALGPARVHALVRAPRRGRQARRTARAGARGLSNRPRPAPGLSIFRVPTSRPIAVEATAEPVTRVCQFSEVRAVRVWIDMTASAHPLVFRPLVELWRRAETRSRSRRATTRRRCS